MLDNLLIDGILIIAIVFAVVWLRRNFQLTEIMPGPPWIKFTRKTKPTPASPVVGTQSASVGPQADRDILIGKSQISIDGPVGQANDNTLIGESKIRINSGQHGADKPGEK